MDNNPEYINTSLAAVVIVVLWAITAVMIYLERRKR